LEVGQQTQESLLLFYIYKVFRNLGMEKDPATTAIFCVVPSYLPDSNAALPAFPRGAALKEAEKTPPTSSDNTSYADNLISWALGSLLFVAWASSHSISRS
jgi:hypothetical protein